MRSLGDISDGASRRYSINPVGLPISLLFYVFSIAYRPFLNRLTGSKSILGISLTLVNKSPINCTNPYQFENVEAIHELSLHFLSPTQMTLDIGINTQR